MIFDQQISCGYSDTSNVRIVFSCILIFVDHMKILCWKLLVKYEFPAENSGTNVNLVIAFLRKYYFWALKAPWNLLFCIMDIFSQKHNKHFYSKQTRWIHALFSHFQSRLICTGCCVFILVSFMLNCTDCYFLYVTDMKKSRNTFREFLIVCNPFCFASVLKCSKNDHIQIFYVQCPKLVYRPCSASPPLQFCPKWVYCVQAS